MSHPYELKSQKINRNIFALSRFTVFFWVLSRLLLILSYRSVRLKYNTQSFVLIFAEPMDDLSGNIPNLAGSLCSHVALTKL